MKRLLLIPLLTSIPLFFGVPSVNAQYVGKRIEAVVASLAKNYSCHDTVYDAKGKMKALRFRDVRMFEDKGAFVIGVDKSIVTMARWSQEYDNLVPLLDMDNCKGPPSPMNPPNPKSYFLALDTLRARFGEGSIIFTDEGHLVVLFKGKTMNAHLKLTNPDCSLTYLEIKD